MLEDSTNKMMDSSAAKIKEAAESLENVTIQAPTGLRIANTKGITLKNVHITAATGPDLIADASVQGLVRSQ
jgi:hypothetical protein